MRDIAVAVVCYNNEDEVIAFAKHLSQQSIIDRIQLIVTCNRCDDYLAFCQQIQATLQSSLVYDPGDNLGYIQGCMYGVKESNTEYAWVMICNTDIEFKQRDFFEKSIEDVPDDTWCVGFDIMLSTSGIHQNPFLKRRPSKGRVNIWRLAYSCYPLFRLYFILNEIKPRKSVFDCEESAEVYAVHGSCFIINRNCVNKLLSENHDIFMYEEELLIAEIVYENRRKCFFNNTIGVLHNENQVTGKIGMKRKQKWFKRSFNYLYSRFYSRKRI